MLLELSIRNFAIIEKQTLALHQGLTVLTGETGAGKSIIIDAIQLLVGGRGSAEFIRHGEDKAEIEGFFQLPDNSHPAILKAQEFGIESEDNAIIIQRAMYMSGKSICRINGKMVTISTLREIGRKLIDIHGQHEHQELMDPDYHLPLLDEFGGHEINEALGEYKHHYKQYHETRQSLNKLSENEQTMAHRLDLIQFQYNEIKNAGLEPDEEDRLLEERQKLSNFERVHQSLNNAYGSLNNENTGLDWVGNAMTELERIESLDEEYRQLSETVKNAFYLLEDAKSSVRTQLDMLEYEPERLHDIEARLNEINHLKRKYGNTIDKILEYGAAIEEEIDTILNRESHIEKLSKQLDSIKKEVLLAGAELTDRRKKYAMSLTDAIHQELKELYMDKAVFDVRFLELKEYDDSIHENGLDTVEFYISANPGEPLKPLSKTASGGELSRIMLALKNIFSKHQGITSIIFDEVDTGVSGRVAQAIAEKIYRVSNGSQVLCISHLPQVAAMADTHLFISKEIIEGRTKTSVKPLEKAERVEEIGRMISGKELTSLTEEHVREMLDQAEHIKAAMV
ncbi:DNA recombination protein RecN [Bacillus sp. FJAT-27916]|uniref:DNA repair protein RecN n=1 Tax=Bacillaceae TaxID=186817 RepID=UPI00067086D0|nr:DNA repair protein RecN [Bacillus sp. FJAT-27916]KMY43821.1 DNA recombination protein RecN [Bacillus sp. FJAT-27916]